MKKLSALIAMLFASASLSVLAQGMTAPAAAPSAKSEAPAAKSDAKSTDKAAMAADKKEMKKTHKKVAKKAKAHKGAETAATTSENKGQENKPSDMKAPK